MSQARTLLIRYDEIGLKGKNRKFFEQKLADNIRRVMGPKEFWKLTMPHGRILVETVDTEAERLADRLRYIPGIASYSIGIPVERELSSMAEAAIMMIRPHVEETAYLSFCVRSRRSDKSFPMSTPEIDREIGSQIMQALVGKGLSVDLVRPDYLLEIEIGKEATFIFDQRRPGIGGLPVGSSGNVLCLLSGGIDSPVAAFKMMRRGCRVHSIFFDNQPFLGAGGYEKVKRLAHIINRYQGEGRLYVVPFEEVQVAIRDLCRPKNRVVLYRRMMYRIASALAGKIGAGALVTGESLGQVASQTLENLAAVSKTVTLPVFRPLIGMDKREIIQSAKEIETYSVSIEPQPDCCSVFMPKNPATKSRLRELEQDECGFPVEEFVATALNQFELISPAN